MQVLTSTSHDRWHTIGPKDPISQHDDFLVLRLDKLDDELRQRMALPPSHTEPPGVPAGHRIVLESDQFEAIIPYYSEAGLVDVHVLASREVLVLELFGAAIELDALRERLPWDAEHRAVIGLFIFVEIVLRSFRKRMHVMRDELDHIEEQILDGTASQQLVELNTLHRGVNSMRRSLGEYSDALEEANERFTTGVEVPEIAARLARAHASSVERTLQALSVLRDEITNTNELHRSLVANRQATVINRLTVISVLVLPLTFFTGFFGMNFGWLSGAIGSQAAFWVLGVAIPVTFVTTALILMWRANWLLVLQTDKTAGTHGPTY